MYPRPVDPLLAEDLDEARRTPPEERLRQALALMRTGFRLKLAALRAAHPQASPAEIDERFDRWLAQDD
jgi:hypothetical protein